MGFFQWPWGWKLTNSMAEFLGIQRTWVGGWAPRTDSMAAINGVDPNHLLTGMILQVGDVISRNERVDTPLKFNKIP